MKSSILLALAIMAAPPAQARDDCDVPIKDWQTRDAVRALAETKGWVLQRIKIDDGCYEVHGTDQDGKRFEAKIDPATLTVIEIELNHKRR
ncbi:PepSY domain-containing protein [Rhizobium oryziradicis]|uniref:PepSY domain-containing protein n=1 Tax=Rhizobium oryziradicis TaxID=1867956 RepID=A0A1Q8ZS42_9HYPH|nr:PepSY domain-containing protein [Rhizobium oryziradicis]OLP44899.1 hypothetical protein BJF95_04760 [Rhizobium oryziradicis]